MNKFQIKWGLILGLVLLSGFLLYPTLDWYQRDPAERTKLEQMKLRPKLLLNLGLDLKGGTHLLMELDRDKLPADTDLQDAMARAIETIRNRIDQYGVAEPLIAKQGDQWIVVQLPGITNSYHAKELVGKTALLQFRMVDTSENAQRAIQKIAELGDPFEGGKVSTTALKLVPAGTELLKGREDRFYLVSASVPVTGAMLKNAKVGTGGEIGLPNVDFEFNNDGAKLFGNLTSANVGKYLAIVMDDLVYSAPRINEPIRGGSGVITGMPNLEESKKLAIVLRSGALPAPVKIIEERTVGPSLGEDSIKAGVMSTLVGGLLIFGFLAFYYKLSGLMADVALGLNILFLMASMAYFGSTLTLPGIVGIVLTMAMAVDANVLIFERIKEELASGKPTRIAMTAGYDKAATAIFDSNITVLIAAILLFQFGTGPIKGFAVTLTIGNLISMFTATFVTRLMHESWLANREIDTLSI